MKSSDKSKMSIDYAWDDIEEGEGLWLPGTDFSFNIDKQVYGPKILKEGVMSWLGSDPYMDMVRHDAAAAVEQPKHYQLFPDTEVIDIIRKTLTSAEFDGYCKGNILKYRLRAGEKGDAERDIAKANVYANWLQENEV